MPTLTELQKESDSRALVRRVSKAVALMAPLSVELPEELTGADNLPIDLKTAGFLPIGMVTPDGFEFGRDVEKDEIDALGYANFIRTDITKVPRSVSFTTLETGRRNLVELQYGVDLSTVTPGANGEIVWDEPDLPVGEEYRFIVVAADGPASDYWVMGKGFPTVKLADLGSETWGQEGAIQKEITLDVFTDDELGTPVRHYLGGTGAVKHADVLGYVA